MNLEKYTLHSGGGIGLITETNNNGKQAIKILNKYD